MYVPFILFEAISISILLNHVLNFAILSVSDQFTASEKSAHSSPPPIFKPFLRLCNTVHRIPNIFKGNVIVIYLQIPLIHEAPMISNILILQMHYYCKLTTTFLILQFARYKFFFFLHRLQLVFGMSFDCLK